MAKIKAVELIEIIESMVKNTNINDSSFREMVSRLIKDVDKSRDVEYVYESNGRC